MLDDQEKKELYCQCWKVMDAVNRIISPLEKKQSPFWCDERDAPDSQTVIEGLTQVHQNVISLARHFGVTL
jgi:hypothetical protein